MTDPGRALRTPALKSSGRLFSKINKFDLSRQVRIFEKLIKYDLSRHQIIFKARCKREKIRFEVVSTVKSANFSPPAAGREKNQKYYLSRQLGEKYPKYDLSRQPT